MTKLEIKTYPDPVLLERSREVEDISRVDPDFISGLVDIMFDDDGIGIAAPQVGVSLRIIIVSPEQKRGREKVCVNPEIISESGTQTCQEGCLSLPGIFAEVKRAKKVKVRFRDLQGKEHTLETQDLEARIFQHEIDHLNGKLFIDRLGFSQRQEILPSIRELRARVG